MAPPNISPALSNPDALIVAASSPFVGLDIAAPTDADLDVLTITLDSVPSYGVVEYFDGLVWQTANGGEVLTAAELQSLRYVPPAGEHGGESITYSVFDGINTVEGQIDVSVQVTKIGPPDLIFSANPGTVSADLYSVDETGALTPIPMTPPDGSAAGADGGYFQFAGKLFFNAFSPATGFALHQMSASGAVTAVGDGSGGYFGDISADAHFTKFAGSLYFRAAAAAGGDELVKLNEDGSSQVFDLNPGGSAGSPGALGGFTVFDHALFFDAITATTSGFNPNLIRLDADGTVTEISTRASGNEAFGSLAGEDGGFVEFDGALFFNAYDDTYGDAMFRLDAGSTTPVLVDPTGTEMSHFFGIDSAFHVFDGALYFNAFSTDAGAETLMKLDDAGTLTSLDYSGLPLQIAGALGGFADFGDSTYFVADTTATGVDLFRLDDDGMVTAIDVNPTGDAFDQNLISGFVVFDGALFFSAYNSGGDDLYRLDADGTLAAVELGGGGTVHAGIEGGFAVSNGSLYFSAFTADGYELVRLDDDGTVTSYDINAGPGNNSTPGDDGGFGVFPLNVLDGTLGDDIIAGSSKDEMLNGGEGRDHLIGRQGGDVLYGGAGIDRIAAGEGDDIAYGGGNADIIFSGGGVDTLFGGKGNDQFGFEDAFTAADSVNGGAGTDTLRLSGDYSGGVTFAAATMVNVEEVNLGPGFDYDLTFNDGNVAAGETLTVEAAHAGTNALTVDGSAETDGQFVLSGARGGDTLTGGAGADRIRGGIAADALTGNGGADTFVYLAVAESTGKSHDTVTGFDATADDFELWFAVTGVDTAIATGSLSGPLFNGDLAAAVNGTNLAAHHAVLFTADAGDYSGVTFLVVDVNGIAGYQKNADVVVRLDGATNLGSLGTEDFTT